MSFCIFSSLSWYFFLDRGWGFRKPLRARARYEAGLAPLTEVADAERLLAQAETGDALSRLGIWQALLAEASARGTLTPFLDQVK